MRFFDPAPRRAVSLPAFLLASGLAGWLLLAAPAVHAGTIAEGVVDLNQVGSTVELQILMTSGAVAHAAVLYESAAGVRVPVATGSVMGAGVDITRIQVLTDGSVDFTFDAGSGVGAGEQTDAFFVVYGAAAPGDVVSIELFDTSGGSVTVDATLLAGAAGFAPNPVAFRTSGAPIPEPGAALLFAVGFATVGRKLRRG